MATRQLGRRLRWERSGRRSAIGHSTRDASLALDLDVQRLVADQGRVERHPRRERIVERDPAVAALGAERKAMQREVGHEPRDAGLAAMKPRRQLALAQHHLARDVERHQLERQSGLEDGRRGFRIDIEVVLGARGDVAGRGHGPSHDDDPADPSEPRRIALDGHREVRERRQGDHDQLVPEAICHLENQIGPVAHLKGMRQGGIPGPAVGLDEAVEVAEPVVAMDMPRGDQRALEGRGGPASGLRHGGRLGDVEDPEDVAGRPGRLARCRRRP